MSLLVIHQSYWGWDRMEARVCGRRVVTLSDACVHVSLSLALLPPNVQSSPSAVGSLIKETYREHNILSLISLYVLTSNQSDISQWLQSQLFVSCWTCSEIVISAVVNCDTPVSTCRQALNSCVSAFGTSYVLYVKFNSDMNLSPSQWWGKENTYCVINIMRDDEGQMLHIQNRLKSAVTSELSPKKRPLGHFTSSYLT